MKMSLGRSVLVLAVALAAAGCASSPAAPAAQGALPATPDTILIYGRPTCGNCQALRASLDAAGISYIDYNVDTDPARHDEMWRKIRSVTPDTDSVMLPVVDVNGTVLVNAPTSVTQLRPYLHGQGS